MKLTSVKLTAELQPIYSYPTTFRSCRISSRFQNFQLDSGAVYKFERQIRIDSARCSTFTGHRFAWNDEPCVVEISTYRLVFTK